MYFVCVNGSGDLVAFEIEDDSSSGFLAAEGFADRRLFYSPGVTEDNSSSFRGTIVYIMDGGVEYAFCRCSLAGVLCWQAACVTSSTFRRLRVPRASTTAIFRF